MKRRLRWISGPERFTRALVGPNGRAFCVELKLLLELLPEAERLATIDRIRELIFDDPTMLDVAKMLVAYKIEILHPEETP